MIDEELREELATIRNLLWAFLRTKQHANNSPNYS